MNVYRITFRNGKTVLIGGDDVFSAAAAAGYGSDIWSVVTQPVELVVDEERNRALEKFVQRVTEHYDAPAEGCECFICELHRELLTATGETTDRESESHD